MQNAETGSNTTISSNRDFMLLCDVSLRLKLHQINGDDFILMFQK